MQQFLNFFPLERKTVSGTFIRGTLRRTDEPIAMPFLQLDVVFDKLLRVVPELFGDAMANGANFVDDGVGRHSFHPFLMQQFLNFFPLPQGQGSLRPTRCWRLRIGCGL